MCDPPVHIDDGRFDNNARMHTHRAVVCNEQLGCSRVCIVAHSDDHRNFDKDKHFRTIRIVYTCVLGDIAAHFYSKTGARDANIYIHLTCCTKLIFVHINNLKFPGLQK